MQSRTFLQLLAVFLLAIGLAVSSAYAVVQVDHASPQNLPAGHPEIGPGSPAVNPQVSKRRMDATEHIIAENRTAFKKKINLATLRLLALQNRGQMKILDSWARQSMERICGYQSINGENPLYTALDMAFRPEAWDVRPCIYIQYVPLRKGLEQFVSSPAERKRMLFQGTVSPDFLERPDVQQHLQNIAQSDNRLAGDINQINSGLATFAKLRSTLNMIPPPQGHSNQAWLNPVALLAAITANGGHAGGAHGIFRLPGYSRNAELNIALGFDDLQNGWRWNHPNLANSGIKRLAEFLPLVNPSVYPSRFRRDVELWYNRLYDGTIVGVFFYFIALTLFLLAAVGAAPGVSRAAFAFFTVAVLVHATFMATRWWLAGRIPIQNEFESVLGSAFVGCVVGWILEYRKRNNLFGLAFSFVGFLAMTACFVTPYVLGVHIGQNIGKVDGVLSSYWLYMHVNIVISSYALIGASFCLGLVYLGTRFYFNTHPLETVPPAALAMAGGGGLERVDSGGAAVADAGHGAGDRGGNPYADTDGGDGGSGKSGSGGRKTPELPTPASRSRFLEQLDAANIVVLQMAFWFLGTGIILGAVWADKSWGRPWGWDPKETFALVTWIVYLIIVHLRFVTPKYRASWTAWMSIIGFAVMMFNWIGVNFFLVGLHSYA